MSEENKIQKGLPGLLPIREALALTQAAVGKMCGPKGRHEDYIRHIEAGIRDCSQTVQRELSLALCCTLPDLVAKPSPKRLQEIKNAYEVRNAKEVLARQADKKAGAA